MDRRRFLMGMGAFAGAALIVPKAAIIFDMGRADGLVVPLRVAPYPTDMEILSPQWLRLPVIVEPPIVSTPVGRKLTPGPAPIEALRIGHGDESVPYYPGFAHTFSDGTFYAERNGILYRASSPTKVEFPQGTSWSDWSAPQYVNPDPNPDPEYRKWLTEQLSGREKRWTEGPRTIGLTPITR